MPSPACTRPAWACRARSTTPPSPHSSPPPPPAKPWSTTTAPRKRSPNSPATNPTHRPITRPGSLLTRDGSGQPPTSESSGSGSTLRHQFAVHRQLHARRTPPIRHHQVPPFRVQRPPPPTVRDFKPSLFMIRLTCTAAVPSVITSASPISRLLRPRVRSTATLASRGVKGAKEYVAAEGGSERDSAGGSSSPPCWARVIGSILHTTSGAGLPTRIGSIEGGRALSIVVLLRYIDRTHGSDPLKSAVPWHLTVSRFPAAPTSRR